MNTEIRDQRFLEVVGSPVLEQIATGFAFTEGPIWHHDHGHLTFSDIPGDQMHRWFEADGRVESFRKPSNMANGNTFDREGRIVTCEHATSRVTRTEHNGDITVLATRFCDKQLNSPNDIVVRRDGRIFFTDPTYGRMDVFGVPREVEMGCQGVYFVTPDGKLINRIADDFGQPNGLCFSLDETRLFVNDTERCHIRCFDISENGEITGGDVWVEVTGEGEGHPDGMKIDSQGNLYCTGPGGVHVIAPDKTCLGVILMHEFTANFTWGGEDMKTMFFTSSTSLYRARTETPGLRLF